MPQLNAWDRSLYPAANDDPDIPDDIRKALASISGRTVQHFDSVAARDAAFAALSTTQQKAGALAHVAGKGLYYYSETSSTWRYVQANGEFFTQSGQTGITTSPWGHQEIKFPVPFGAIPVVQCTHASGSMEAPALNATIIIGGVFQTNTYFNVRLVDMNGNPYVNAYADVTWIAHGPRGVD